MRTFSFFIKKKENLDNILLLPYWNNLFQRIIEGGFCAVLYDQLLDGKRRSEIVKINKRKKIRVKKCGFWIRWKRMKRDKKIKKLIKRIIK